MAGDEEAVGGQKGREDYVEQQVQVEIRPTHTVYLSIYPWYSLKHF